jgi:hypothetical protein
VILEGDDGGQIYVVVPARQVGCSEEALTWLLHDLDQISWPGNDEGSARVVFERVAVGTGVACRMRGWSFRLTQRIMVPCLSRSLRFLP